MSAGLVWSVALAAAGILGIYLAGRKNLWGWAIGCGAQVLWVIYALVTVQYGFILSAVAYGLVYGRNWHRWATERRSERQPMRKHPKTVTKKLRAAMDLRDGHRCAWHGVFCDPETLVPHHRSNRGQGGDPSKNRLSNLVWLCSRVNELSESIPTIAALARKSGIKLSLHDEPTREPIDHAVHGLCFLDDDGTWRPA